MRIDAPYNPDLTALDALTASLRDWLGGLLGFLLHILATLDPAARRRERILNAQHARVVLSSIRRILFLRALAALKTEAPPQRDRLHHHRTRTLPMRALMRTLTNRALATCQTGNLEARIATLESVLAQPSAMLARIIARARRVTPKLRLVRILHAREATNDALAPARIAHHIAHADTS